MARKKHSIVKATMFITLIITMNLLGISYGQWQNGLASEMNISTGFIQPDFAGKVGVKKTGDLNKPKVSLKTDNSAESKYVKLTGEIESDKRGKLTLDYKVINKGSLPIRFDGEAFAEINKRLFKRNSDGVRILINKPSNKVIYPQGNKSSSKDKGGSMTLQIDAPREAGEYEFEIIVPYKQWNEN